jgi:RNase P/RNase MRP subunit POP5
MVRLKNRYLLFDLHHLDGVEMSTKELAQAITQSVQINFGSVGLGQIMPQFSRTLCVYA